MKYYLMEIRAFFLFYLPAMFRIKKLLHHYDSTRGLWCTDIEPKIKQTSFNYNKLWKVQQRSAGKVLRSIISERLRFSTMPH